MGSMSIIVAFHGGILCAPSSCGFKIDLVFMGMDQSMIQKMDEYLFDGNIFVILFLLMVTPFLFGFGFPIGGAPFILRVWIPVDQLEYHNNGEKQHK